MALDYTPEQKSRLEIEKLYAEVVDLRSWVRRWLGTLGGLLGIVTAAASVIVTSTQWSRSTREADLKMKQAEARLAQADKRDADKALEEIRAKTDATAKELETKNGELADLEKRLAGATEKLANARESARALAVTAKPRPFSVNALNLILDAEGVDQPGRWTGANSGIVLGVGYDLGLVTKESFESDWKKQLSPEQINRLTTAVGLTGSSAQALAPGFADIVITREAAAEVFERVTLPQYVARTAEVFPGFDKLPLDAQGALVSLVINLGTNLAGDRKKEMRAIRDLVPMGDLPAIAREIRAMKRLWEGKPGLQGLTKHREAEAALLESAR
jgi:GH24 family phage-related lysozyme (muramidase)